MTMSPVVCYELFSGQVTIQVVQMPYKMPTYDDGLVLGLQSHHQTSNSQFL